MKRLLLSATLLLGLTGVALAQDSFPSETLNIVVPYAPGGSSDALTRAIGQAISQENDISVVIDNRPGGGTVIGAQRMLSQKPDGHTVFVMAASFVINPYMMPKLPYDSKNDFQAVTLLASNPHLLVANAGVGATDLDSFLAWAKAPGSNGTYSSFGNGSSGHLGFELLKEAADIDLLHIPYKGSAPATLAVLTGEVDATLGDVGVIAPHLTDGKLVPIAITGDERLNMLPDVPTFKEAGLAGFQSQTWLGLLAHADVPVERINKLNELFIKALDADEVKTVMAQQGMQARPKSPEEFAAFLKEEEHKYKSILESANITAQ